MTRLDCCGYTKKRGGPGFFAVAVFIKKAWPIGADRLAPPASTVLRTGVGGFHGSRCRKGKVGTHKSPQCYPQPCGDFCPKLVYLSGDIDTPPLPPHLAPGVRRCSAIALRLGGYFEFTYGVHKQ
jgi:hypothetical protein